MTWIESDASLARRQAGRWAAQGLGSDMYCAQILRAGTRATAGVAEFFDVIILSREWGLINLNSNAEYNSSGRAAYPVLLNCATVADVSIGDYVLVRWSERVARINRPYVPTPTLTHDLVVHGADGTIVSTDGSGGADGYFQGARDLGFGGMISD